MSTAKQGASAEGLSPARIVGTQGLGGGWVRLRLEPAAPVVAWPGQQVRLGALLDGRWETGAFPLCAPGERPGPLELLVRGAAGGRLGAWLCGEAAVGAVLGCSAPEGDLAIQPCDRGPIYAFVAGSALGLGLGLARGLATDGRGRRLHLHLWLRGEPPVSVARELAAIGQVAPGVSVSLHRTDAGGARVQAAAVGALAPFGEGSLALVSGPVGFVEELSSGLAAAGWPASAVRVERRAAAEAAGSAGPIVARSFHLDPGPVKDEAMAFLDQMAAESEVDLSARRRAVAAEIAARGTYVQRAEELEFGARLAWRNATRCVGRASWRKLDLRDQRHLSTAADVAAALFDHIEAATQGGALRSTVSLFRPGPPTIRLWNAQLLRYAGYRRADGSVLGDPISVDLTERIRGLGWRGAGTAFDLLPLVVQIGDAAPQVFPIPPGLALEVPLRHPQFPWFEGLGLRWYALPAVSDMALDLGGVVYRCAPFNGYYVGTEIGARNLGDAGRYNLCPLIAERMGLDTRAPSSLWRDRALIELNTAVLYSFSAAGVRISDHHSVGEQFLRFERTERAAGRPVYGDWSWLVPPISGSASPLFARSDLRNVLVKPMFVYQPPPWQAEGALPPWEGPVPPCPFADAQRASRA
jgi:nitric-oxide synthase